MSKVWVVRAGRDEENEQFNVDNGVATVSWAPVGALTQCQSREDVRALVDEAYPADSLNRKANYTGQLWAFRGSIEPGDLVVMPSKLQPGYIRIGRCTGPFQHDSAEPDKTRRKQIPVEWSEDAVPRSAIKDDLLNSLGAISTVFNPTRNDAAARLERVAETGIDPGRTGASSRATKKSTWKATDVADMDNGVTDPEVTPTVESIRDRGDCLVNGVSGGFH